MSSMSRMPRSSLEDTVERRAPRNALHALSWSNCGKLSGQASAGSGRRLPHREEGAERWGGEVPASAAADSSPPRARARSCPGSGGRRRVPRGAAAGTAASTRLGCGESTRGGRATSPASPTPSLQRPPWRAGARAPRRARGDRRRSAGQARPSPSARGAAAAGWHRSLRCWPRPGLRQMSWGGLQAVGSERTPHSPGLTPSPRPTRRAASAAAGPPGRSGP